MRRTSPSRVRARRLASPDQEQIGGAAPGASPGGTALKGGPRLAGQPDRQGGGAAPVHIDRPLTALCQQLLGQIHLGQAGGVAGLPSIHRIEHQGAVGAHADGGAGLTAVAAVGPVGAVCDGAVLNQNIPHAAGPLGLGQVGVVTSGLQSDPVAHLEGGIHKVIARGVGGRKDVLILPDVQRALSLDHFGHFQFQRGVDGQLLARGVFQQLFQLRPAQVLPIQAELPGQLPQLGPVQVIQVGGLLVHQLHAHKPAGSGALGVLGGEILVI